MGFSVLVLQTDAFGGHGGIALYNRDLLTALVRSEQVDSATSVIRWLYEDTYELPAGIKEDRSGLGGWFSYLVATCRHALASDQRYQLVVCSHIRLLPIAWLVSKIRRLPLILEIYGIEAWESHGWRAPIWMLRGVDRVVSISQLTADRFCAWSTVDTEKMFILPNAIHIDWYSPVGNDLRSRYGLEGKKVLLTFGRLVSMERAKGFDEVLEVLPVLSQKIDNLHYVIAGDGPYRLTLEKKVAALGLTDVVTFTGPVDESEKGSLYRSADLFVMPSRGEGFGFVFLEAMASGIPVVASSVDGSREAVLFGELGQLVDPDSKQGLIEAIEAGLEQQKGVPEGLSHFSFDSFSDRVSSLVKAVVRTK